MPQFLNVTKAVGSEVLFLASCISAQLTDCVDPQNRARPHAEMEFLVNMNRMYLFWQIRGDLLIFQSVQAGTQ
jgi:hypothetical protein